MVVVDTSIEARNPVVADMRALPNFHVPEYKTLSAAQENYRDHTVTEHQQGNIAHCLGTIPLTEASHVELS